MKTHEFETLVGEVLDSLPPAFASRLDNLEIIVARRPSRQQRQELGLQADESLYGYYEGVPLPERTAWDAPLPAIIYIFQEPLQRDFSTADALQEQVRRTVLHEIAHHFGISDERLTELGAY